MSAPEAKTWRPMAALRQDLFRVTGQSSLRPLPRVFLLRREFRPIATLRICQALAQAGAWSWMLPLGMLMHRFSCGLAGMDLPWQVNVGPGLIITHGWGLVINAKAVIGANVTLFHGVTLGQADRLGPDGERSAGYPVIEDDVWLGPHAIVVGGICVGQGSRLAAGVMLASSVPERSLVLGNPGQIVRSDCVPDVPNRAPLA